VILARSPRFRTFAALLARFALAAGFLSSVADRFGIWGRPGASHVLWGDFQHFVTYTETLNPFVPKAVAPAIAWLVTVLETGFGLGLLLGIRTKAMALGSGCLLLLFSLAMTVSVGVHPTLAYSVVSAAGAALLLAWVSDNL